LLVWSQNDVESRILQYGLIRGHRNSSPWTHSRVSLCSPLRLKLATQQCPPITQHSNARDYLTLHIPLAIPIYCSSRIVVARSTDSRISSSHRKLSDYSGSRCFTDVTFRPSKVPRLSLHRPSIDCHTDKINIISMLQYTSMLL